MASSCELSPDYVSLVRAVEAYDVRGLALTSSGLSVQSFAGIILNSVNLKQFSLLHDFTLGKNFLGIGQVSWLYAMPEDKFIQMMAEQYNSMSDGFERNCLIIKKIFYCYIEYAAWTEIIYSAQQLSANESQQLSADEGDGESVSCKAEPLQHNFDDGLSVENSSSPSPNATWDLSSEEDAAMDVSLKFGNSEISLSESDYKNINSPVSEFSNLDSNAICNSIMLFRATSLASTRSLLNRNRINPNRLKRAVLAIYMNRERKVNTATIKSKVRSFSRYHNANTRVIIIPELANISDSYTTADVIRHKIVTFPSLIEGMNWKSFNNILYVECSHNNPTEEVFKKVDSVYTDDVIRAILVEIYKSVQWSKYK